jgi:hypothetical protein
MSDRIEVKIDLPALIAHLSREEGRGLSQAEVLQWLEDAGFTRAGEWWAVAEADLGQLDPSEVLDVRRVKKHG